jgi:hypothetical protein
METHDIEPKNSLIRSQHSLNCALVPIADQ